MTALRATTAIARRSILFVLLLALVTSGVPLVDVHAHEDASFGHSHATLDHEHASIDDHDASSPADETDDPGALHVHSLDTPALTLIELAPADPDCVMNACDGTVLRSRPPDNVIAPLYRPPIV
jgi:hypothetical protein